MRGCRYGSGNTLLTFLLAYLHPRIDFFFLRLRSPDFEVGPSFC